MNTEDRAGGRPRLSATGCGRARLGAWCSSEGAESEG